MRTNGEPKTKLTFHYSAMGGGKTLEIILQEHRARQAGYKTMIAKPSIDKKAGEEILTRFGEMRRPIDTLIGISDNLYGLLNTRIGKSTEKSSWIVFIDEAQFLTPAQVDSLRKAADSGLATIEAYGLRTDFKGSFFPGSAALLAHADHIKEITSPCEIETCGRPAIYNSRYVNGQLTKEGDQVAIDGIDATYQALCSYHYGLV